MTNLRTDLFKCFWFNSMHYCFVIMVCMSMGVLSCVQRGLRVVRLWGSYPLWSSVRGDRDGPGSPESRSRHSSGDRWSEISLRRDHGARGHQTHSLWPFQKWTEQWTCGEKNCSNDYHTRHLLKYLSSSLSSAGFAKQKGVWEYIFIKPLSQ